MEAREIDMNKLSVKRINWREIRIKNKKDWVIFWIFAGLVCYGISAGFEQRNGNWLFQFANPYMMRLNEPHTWGQLLAAVMLFAIVVEAVLFLRKKSVKAKVLVLIVLLFTPMLAVAGYRVNTNLIVSQLWQEEPGSITIRFHGQGEELESIDGDRLTEEERQELLTLCKSMTIVSDSEKQEELMQWFRQSEGSFLNSDKVELRYGEKYGHNYRFTLWLEEGKIYLWRDNGAITFFEDNGINAWMEEVLSRFQAQDNT